MNDHPRQPASSGSGRFVANVFWNWLGMLSNIAAAFLLTPFLIRHLGEQRYGMWSLTYSLIDYCWFLDLGFRSATLNFVAFYHAKSDRAAVSSVINTSLLYFTGVGLVVGIVVILAAPFIPMFFQVPAPLHHEFRSLIILVGLSWGLGAIFLVFRASLEGLQRFDVISRVNITSTTARVVAWMLLLATGHGTLALVEALLAIQIAAYVFEAWFLRRVLQGLRFSWRSCSWAWLRKLNGYGVHTFVSTASQQAVTQTPPVVIGHWAPVAFVGYYNVANRLLATTVSDLVARVGVVSSPRSAELAALGDLTGAGRLTMYLNRYCTMLILPVCIMLGVFGRDLLTAWIGRDVAVRAMPLLVPLMLGAGMIASQFNSSAVLYGVASHQGFAKGFVAEAVVGVLAMLAVAPHFGGLGVVWVVAVVGALNRGVLTSWLLCRRLNLSWQQFLVSIYSRPLAIGALTLGLAWLLKMRAGENLGVIQLLGLGILITAVHGSLCLAFSTPPQHRAFLYSQGRKLVERFRGVPASEVSRMP